MAGPQFLAPKRTSANRPVRHFTLAEANRALPLVKRIVGDIVRVHEQVEALQPIVAAAKPPEQIPLAKDLERLVDQLQAYVEELRGVGCDLKDFQLGLVDFTGRHHGRDICLCWKLGEEKIEFWHEIQAGVAGRQPVSTLHEE